MADASVSKTDTSVVCEFESHSGHHSHSPLAALAMQVCSDRVLISYRFNIPGALPSTLA